MDMVAVVDWPVAVRVAMRMRGAMRVRMSGIAPPIWGRAAQRAAARGLRLQVGRGGGLQPRLVDLHVHAVARVAGIPLPQVRLRCSARRASLTAAAWPGTPFRTIRSPCRLQCMSGTSR